MAPTNFEMSKTYQYRKVMKPLLERKRRARINKCLDDLKDLIAKCIQQQSGDPNIKLEKADILELTVQHLRNIKAQKLQQCRSSISGPQSFRSGYIQAANEVSRCLATLPKVDIALGTKLMTHLGLRLNQLESSAGVEEQPIAVSTPLNISCAPAATQLVQHTYPSMYSPVSSGYASDNESATSQRIASPALTSHRLLQVAAVAAAPPAPMWRPW